MTIVCAHRGASAHLPDNSVEAFRAAIEAGADAIEADLRRTADGRLVLEHDLLSSYPRSLPLLADLVTMARGRVRLDIELKEAGYEREVLEALSPLPPDLLISSFLPSALAAVRELDRSVETALIIERRDRWGDLFARADRCGANLVAPHVSLLDDDLRAAALERSRPLVVWTVNDPATLSDLLADPAVGWVITDVPDVALQLRSG
ncbi:MAG: glycerophosphoryl diester phosphodiesterase [Gaiellales bacterium]|nr:glycerophosphoryl diester phosphodiesterase [Gaiellales bacterium]